MLILVVCVLFGLAMTVPPVVVQGPESSSKDPAGGEKGQSHR